MRQLRLRVRALDNDGATAQGNNINKPSSPQVSESLPAFHYLHRHPSHQPTSRHHGTPTQSPRLRPRLNNLDPNRRSLPPPHVLPPHNRRFDDPPRLRFLRQLSRLPSLLLPSVRSLSPLSHLLLSLNHVRTRSQTQPRPPHAPTFELPGVVPMVESEMWVEVSGLRDVAD